MKRRILICLMILFSLCVIGPVIAMLCLSNSVQRLSALGEYHRIQSLRSELAAAGIRIEKDLLQAERQRPPERATKLATLTRFEDTLRACSACHHNTDVQARLDQLQGAFDKYRTKVDYLIVVGKPDAFALDPEVQELAAGLVNRATAMADEAAKHLAVRSSDAMASVRRSWRALLATLFGSVIISGLVATHLAKRLTGPLSALLGGIERIRLGDVNHRFVVTGDAEYRTLGGAFNQAYDTVRRAQTKALQAEKLAFVGRLSAGAAHEVGNPLASISSVAQMMRRECHNAKEEERIELIMQHIDRVTRVVRRLLTFARPPVAEEYGRVEIEPLLQDAIALLRYDKRSANVRITCQCDRDLSLERGDKDRLLMVFANIMLNAIDALSDLKNGGAYIAITARAAGERVSIQFEDNGPGMTVEQIDEAFEPFFTSGDPDAGGGLGLWVCKQIVGQHYAEIRIDSHAGRGTTVTLDLPRQPSPDFLKETALHC
ncbi:MAG: HAMP domain-containing histidine kinase [Phycisphaerales bacterium]|nr:MAG: HAMP domain-containing histidine kinase [Phycisphaerales bacterium]